MEILWSLDASDENAQKIVDKIAATMDDTAILMCFSDNDAISPVLFSSLDNKNFAWNKQQHGWLFYHNAELKWRRLGDKIRFVYLGTHSEIPENARSGHDIIDNTEVEPSQLIAWGIFGGDFDNDDIPQTFSYPVSGNPPHNGARVAFKIKKFVDQDSGALKIWRHTGMDWFQKNCKE